MPGPKPRSSITSVHEHDIGLELGDHFGPALAAGPFDSTGGWELAVGVGDQDLGANADGFGGHGLADTAGMLTSGRRIGEVRRWGGPLPERVASFESAGRSS